MVREAMRATRLTANTATKTPRQVNVVMLYVAREKGNIIASDRMERKSRA